ncbi:MAG: hypothetical protein JW966_02440 [Anaerolineae bacterium]|nr:hypothetical protein [Anaerolineae bacterium]
MAAETPQLPGDDTPENDAGGHAKRRTGRSVPVWIALPVMVGALVLAALILARIAGPLYGLLFPLEPPVPDGAKEIEHVKPDKGAEYWIYRSDRPGMEIAAFYEEDNGRCWYSPQPQEPVEGASVSIAQCTGYKESAGLRTSWEVYISEENGQSVFRVYKFSEVGW